MADMVVQERGLAKLGNDIVHYADAQDLRRRFLPSTLLGRFPYTEHPFAPPIKGRFSPKRSLEPVSDRESRS
jgi:hypothetical protein